MKEKVNLHEGHRERMINKFMQSPQNAEDHELLEILLFSVLPRKDTNALAHRLIRTFGSLSRVVSATKEELTTVEGVGNKVASEIMVIGRIAERLSQKREDSQVIGSLFDIKTKAMADFMNDKEEKLVVYLLDKTFKKILTTQIDGTLYNVEINLSELAKAIAIHKPKYTILIHNHPSGTIEPSEWDDITTKKIHMLCALHGANLVEHVIVHKNTAFSYFQSGRMDEIKRFSDLDSILNTKQGENKWIR